MGTVFIFMQYVACKISPESGDQMVFKLCLVLAIAFHIDAIGTIPSKKKLESPSSLSVCHNP